MPLTPEQQQEYARRRLALGSNAEIDRSRLNQDRDINTRLIQDAGVRGQTEVANQMGSQGLYNSGIRINEQGQIVRQTNEALGELGLSTGRGLEDITRNLTTGLADVDFQQAQTLAESARREAEAEDRRAQLAAIAAAAPVQPVAMPQPVIQLPQLDPNALGLNKPNDKYTDIQNRERMARAARSRIMGAFGWNDRNR